jgi:hypothetical protein
MRAKKVADGAYFVPAYSEQTVLRQTWFASTGTIVPGVRDPSEEVGLQSDDAEEPEDADETE